MAEKFLGVMQPYFLPYLGYWQLFHAVDKIVVYDNIQYSKRGWFNRNKILANGEEKTISIPLKKESDFLHVNQRTLADNADVNIHKILNIIKQNYRKAPYFDTVFPLIEEILLYDSRNLFDYVFNSIVKIKSYIGLHTEILLSSRLEIDHSLKKENKLRAILEHLHFKNYINPIGGKEIYSKEMFKEFGVNLYFIRPYLREYEQFGNEFRPGLSILDVMMFNSREQILEMLDDYELE